MMQLTEEQRKALVEYCESRISELAPYAKQRKVMEIALAALMAKPVAYVHPAYLQPGALGFDASVGRLAPAQVKLYTTPPVAALRLPNSISLSGDMDEVYVAAWNDCIEEVKRLSATATEEKRND